jgi:hypothetical protein
MHGNHGKKVHAWLEWHHELEGASQFHGATDEPRRCQGAVFRSLLLFFMQDSFGWCRFESMANKL